MKKMNFIDLFAGCGGLSEGFYRQGFNALAHVEINHAACETLKTRMRHYGYEDVEKAGIFLYDSDFNPSDSLKRRVEQYTKMNEGQLEEIYNQTVYKSGVIKEETLKQAEGLNRDQVKELAKKIEQLLENYEKELIKEKRLIWADKLPKK